MRFVPPKIRTGDLILYPPVICDFILIFWNFIDFQKQVGNLRLMMVIICVSR